MKIAAIIASTLLGLLFIMSGVTLLFNLVEMPPIPEGTPEGHFMAAVMPTGFMKFVKVVEVVGGLLLLVPKTRNLGLLAVGPVIVNILAFHFFVKGDLLSAEVAPMLAGISAISLFLLWVERRAWLGLVHR